MTNKGYYETRFTYDKNREKVWKIICEYLSKEISENSIVLDLGAGYCNFINNIKAKKKYAVDNYEEFKINANKDVKAVVCNSYDLNLFQNDFFEVVFSSNMLEHLTLDKIVTTIKEIYRILKKGGILILILPNWTYSYKNYYDDYTHITPLTHIGICDLLKTEGFNIKKCIPKFLPFSFKSRLPKIPFLVWLYLRLPFKPFAKQMLIIAEKNERI